MSEKLLSVIVPSYNMEGYLPKCLGSLVVADAELLRKLDVIVVNDGSKDRTSEIAHDFERRYPGVFRVIDKANGHYGSCINAALPQAVGRYVRVLDADDSVDTDGFGAYLEWLKSVDADVVAAPYCHVDGDGRVTSHSVISRQIPLSAESVDDLAGTCFLPIHAVAYRTGLFSGGWYRQLEGICYTDCQWSTVPVLKARTLRCFSKEVTRYLVGREGQSVEIDTRIRNIRQQLAVDVELARVHCEESRSKREDGAWRYFERALYNQLMEVFRHVSAVDVGRRIDDAVSVEFRRNLDGCDPGWEKGFLRFLRGAVGRMDYVLIRSFLKDALPIFRLKRSLCRSYRRFCTGANLSGEIPGDVV